VISDQTTEPVSDVPANPLSAMLTLLPEIRVGMRTLLDVAEVRAWTEAQRGTLCRWSSTILCRLIRPRLRPHRGERLPRHPCLSALGNWP